MSDVDVDKLRARGRAAQERARRRAVTRAEIRLDADTELLPLLAELDQRVDERDRALASLRVERDATARLTAELDQARTEIAALTEFGIDLAAHELMTEQRDDALRKLAGATEYAEELRDERARIWPMAQVLPAVEAEAVRLRGVITELTEAVEDVRNCVWDDDAEPFYQRVVAALAASVSGHQETE